MKCLLNGIILFMIIGPLMCIGINAQTYYYYNGDDRIDLTVDSNFIAIEIDEYDFIGWDSLFSLFGDLIESEPAEISNEYYRLELQSRATLEDIFEALDRVEGVDDVSYVFASCGNGHIYLHNRIGFLFESGFNQNMFDSIITANDLDIQSDLQSNPFIYILSSNTRGRLELLQLANEIYEIGLCRYGSIDLLEPMEPLLVPNDYYYDDNQYYFHDDYGDFEEAYDYTLRDTAILIAFLDSGLEPHEDLPDSMIFGGYDYVDWTSDYGLDDNCGASNNRDYHGLAVAGMVAATINNEIDIAGITHHVQLMMQRIFKCEQNAYSFDIAYAIIHAADSGAAIINNSWGKGDCSAGHWFIEMMLDSAYGLGAFIVGASGNENDSIYQGDCVEFPASHAKCFAVGATQKSHNVWDYSMYDNYAYDINVAAPGFSITTLDQMGFDTGFHKITDDIPCSHDYDVVCGVSGTSYSAAQVSGLAALLMARRPDFIGHPDTIAFILERSTGNGWRNPPIEDTLVKTRELGYGEINAARAMLAVCRGDLNNDAIINILDLTYLIDYVYYGGNDPVPNWRLGDLNCDGYINIHDIDYIIAFIYQQGPDPVTCFKF